MNNLPMLLDDRNKRAPAIGHDTGSAIPWSHEPSEMTDRPDASGRYTNETDPAVRVVVLYEDAAAGRRAMSLLAKLAAEIGTGGEVGPALWRFDLLDCPCGGATTDVFDADVLLVSSTRTAGVPDRLWHWIEGHLDQRSGAEPALVVLLDPHDAWIISLQELESGRRPWARAAGGSPAAA